MRSTSTKSTPMPSTLIENYATDKTRIFTDKDFWIGISSVLVRGFFDLLACVSRPIILHQREHLADSIFPAHKNRARHDSMPDVELGEVRNFVNERDILIIDSMPGVDL